jgi:hypothetical protein
MEQVFDRTIPLVEDGKLWLEDRDARIEITGWERAEVRLRAVRRGVPSADPDALRVEIETPPGGLRLRTVFRTADTVRSRDEHATTELSLQVPRRATLERISSINGSVRLADFDGRAVVATVSGEIHVSGTRGDLDLSSVDGRVRAAPADAGPASTFALHSVSGEVDVTLPAVLTDVQIIASTLQGTITPPAGYRVEEAPPFGSKLSVTLGEGGAEVRVRTVTGAIRFTSSSEAQ